MAIYDWITRYRDFEKIIEKILSPRKIFKGEIFELFLEVGSLFVLKDADHFKPKIFFSILGQLSNYPIS